MMRHLKTIFAHFVPKHVFFNEKYVLAPCGIARNSFRHLSSSKYAEMTYMCHYFLLHGKMKILKCLLNILWNFSVFISHFHNRVLCAFILLELDIDCYDSNE